MHTRLSSLEERWNRNAINNNINEFNLERPSELSHHSLRIAPLAQITSSPFHRHYNSSICGNLNELSAALKYTYLPLKFFTLR